MKLLEEFLEIFNQELTSTEKKLSTRHFFIYLAKILNFKQTAT